ncbi:Cu(I)-responsive transcriptional regulator [Chromatiales bacterium (ex Bugula neritina AB1)]|nr:Cu(I)-responsive transcriptional regulator [Chromatiales bacterium (ex Bugula neritina AB1)]
MNIGDVAVRSGLTDKTIRYYESIGLVSPLRGENGYRTFRESDVHKLVFLSRARGLGFSIEDCRNLLQLYEDETRSSSEVKSIARQHLQGIDTKIASLQQMRDSLSVLIDSCAGDNRPECPILAHIGS